MEKRRHAGNGKSVKGSAAVTTTHTQTDYDKLPLDYNSALLTISAHHVEVEALQAEVQNKTQALESAQTLCSELQAAHDSLLQRNLDFEGVQAEKASLAEQLKQAQLHAIEHEEAYQTVHDAAERYFHESLDHTAELSKLRTQNEQLFAEAESLQDSEAKLSSELETMAQRAEAAQQAMLSCEAANLAATQQLNHWQAHCSRLEQTHQQLEALTQGAGETAVVFAAGNSPGGVQSLVMTVSRLLSNFQCRAEAAEAEAGKLTQQLQDAQAAQALEAEHLR